MTWKPTTQTKVLNAIESGHTAPKEIAAAAGLEVGRINSYLCRLDALKKIRREGRRWVPYTHGLALMDAWK